MESVVRCGRLAKTTILLAAFAVLSGCAGKTALAPVFWPPAPDLPRVQFLRAVKDSSDVLDQNMFNLLKMGEKESVNLPIVKPYGVAVNKGKIFLTDSVAAEVLVIDLPGKKMSRLAGNKGAGRLNKPIGIAVHEDGTVYVADTNRLEVLQYDAEGNYVRSFGKDLGAKPADVKSDGSYLYVADSAQNRLLVFNRTSGALVRSIGQEGPPNQVLSLPVGLASDGKGGLYVTNFNGRVIALDRDGHFIKGFGRLGETVGEFGRPRGIAVDRDGLVYIVDAAAQNARIYDDKFRILMDFGTSGTRGALNIPAGIAVSTDNLEYYQTLAAPGFLLEKVIFVVSQFGDHKISIYGLGKKQGVDYDAEYRQINDELEKKRKELEDQDKKAQGAATGSPAPGTPAK